MGMAASGIHQRFLPGFGRERAATPADDDGGESDGDHGDGDPGDLAQDHVVQCEHRIGVVREEPVVLEVEAGIFGGLADVDPVALEGCGDQ